MGTVTIPLTQGKEAIIDEADYPLVSQYRWFAVHSQHTFYARTNMRGTDGAYRPLAMHRLITDAPDGMIPHHRDGNGLNNTRANLSLVTKGDNNRHRVRVRGVSTPLPKTEREGWRAMQARYGNRIPLGSYKYPGMFALVDAEDYERVAQYRWTVRRDKDTYYAFRREQNDTGKWTLVLMHRFIMDALPTEIVDHIHGDGLDNRKSELRKCTNAENIKNQRRRSNNTSGFKGVSFIPSRQDWKGSICVDGKQIHLGYHYTAEEAAEAYDQAARTHHGEYARLNNAG